MYLYKLLKVIETKTQIGIRDIQDPDTLIEQSHSYYNRTFFNNKSWFCYGICPPPIDISIHTMKCIDLFTMPDSTICVCQ